MESIEAMATLINALYEDDESKMVEGTSELFRGAPLYDVMAFAVPSVFEDADAMKRGGKASSWRIRKSNFDRLVKGLQNYGKGALSANEAFDVESMVNTSTIAKDESPDELAKLVSVVAAEAVCAANPAFINKLRMLPTGSQKPLSEAVRSMKAKYGLQKASEPAANAGNADGSLEASTSITPVAATPTAPTAKPIKVYGGDEEESPVVMRAEIKELRSTVTTLRGELNTAESKVELLQNENKDITAKYNRLMEDTQAKGASTKEREYLEQLTEREKTIAQLRESTQLLKSKADDKRHEAEELHEKLAAETAKLTEVQATLSKRTEEKADLQAKAEMEADRAEINVKKREEQETKLNDALKELDALNAKLAKRRGGGGDGEDDDEEVAALRSKLNAANDELAAAQAKLGFMAQSMRGDDHGDSVDALRDELRNQRERFEADLDEAKSEAIKLREELNAKPKATPEEIEALKKELEAAKADAEEAKNNASSSSNLQEELAAKESERERLQTHLSSAVNEIQRLKDTIDSSQSSASDPKLGELQQENEALQKRLQDGRAAMKSEQTLLLSSLASLGQRNLVLQQRSMLGRPRAAESVFGAADDIDSSGGQSFLSKQRRAQERALLDTLARNNNSESPRKRFR